MLEKLKNKIKWVLRWSEQYTHTDMVYLAKGGGWLTGDTLATMAVTFGIALAFGNLVPKNVYGTYKFVLSITSILSIATLPGMKKAVTRAVAQGADSTIFSALKERLQWGILSTLGSLGVSGYYLWQANQELAVAFALVAFLIPLFQSFDLYKPLFDGKKRFDAHAKYDVLTRVTAGAALVTTIFLTDNLFWILLTYFGSWAIVKMSIFYYATNRFIENAENNKKSLTYGKHLSLMRVMNKIANNLDKILLFHFLGATQLAIYSFAKAIPEQGKSILKSLSTLAFPKFTNRSESELQNQLLQKIGIFILVLIPAIIIYWFVAPYLYQIFFPEYTSSIFFSQIYAFSLLGTATLIPKTALLAKGDTKKLYIFNLVGGLFHISILIVLVFFFGIIGAISTIIFKRLFRLGLSYYLVNKI
jgi:O-antigen/teichoic acid export membrane protein